MPPGDGSQSEVASFTDAWIETSQNTEIEPSELVASFTDAWIETTFFVSWIAYLCGVASFTDAWIETTVATRTAAILKSHLLQMRGLKPNFGTPALTTL